MKARKRNEGKEMAIRTIFWKHLQRAFYAKTKGVNNEELEDVTNCRYPMTYDQPSQIDCRVTSCKFYKGAGKCENVSPAITLNKSGKFTCWSKISE
jgi:hypothetical protein